MTAMIMYPDYEQKETKEKHKRINQKQGKIEKLKTSYFGEMIFCVLFKCKCKMAAFSWIFITMIWQMMKYFC